MQERDDGTGRATIKGQNGHEYPGGYAPKGKDSDLDRIWEVIDGLCSLTLTERSFLAGGFVALLMKYKRK